MNEKVANFLDSVCSNIKYKPIHQDIRDELTVHINELKEEYIKNTQNEEKALDMAISAMGDCNEVGKQLNKRHKPETEYSLIGLTFIIAIIGGIVMYACSNFDSARSVNFGRYLFFALVGTSLMAGLYFFDYTKLKRLAWPLYLLSLSLLIFSLVDGISVNGRTIFFIGGSVISTEFTTLLFLISFVGFIDRSRGKGIFAILKLGALAAISVYPIIMQPRFSQALSLLTIYSILIIFAVIKNHFGGNRKRQLIFLGAIAFLCGSMCFSIIFSSAYRSDRITSFITRGTSDPYGRGYQQVIADKWLMASKLFGATDEKINGSGLDATLPCSTTDYVLVTVFATLGKVVGVAFIFVVAVYVGRLFITTRKIKNSYGFYLSLAACTDLALQFVTGILVNFSLLPSASVYIPFVSYGGVGYISSMALVGLVLSVWRRNNLIREQVHLSQY